MLAGHHIAHSMQVYELPATKLMHPMSLVRLAYGL